MILAARALLAFRDHKRGKNSKLALLGAGLIAEALERLRQLSAIG